VKCIEALEHRKDPLSVKEAASIYGDSVGTFYKKIRSGEIPGVFRESGKPRGKIKICPAEFAEWLKKRMAIGCKAAYARNVSTNGKHASAEVVMHARNGSEANGGGTTAERGYDDSLIE
jgi:excisionase family DNA binding protein